jgi:holo-[acyl-carrier protein] synthase
VIVGVGIDVVDIDRFGASLERTPRLTKRLFSVDEQSLALASMAATFAAKEALAKALGAPVGLRWLDVAVVREVDGRPRFVIQGSVQALVDALGVRSLHLSISHDAGVASAVVVAEG